MVGAFNRPRVVAALGMSKNRHVKMLLENKNEILEIIPGKARMVHVFAKEMRVKKLGERLEVNTVMDKGEDSEGGEKNMMTPVPVLKPKVQGELVGESESHCILVLKPEVLGEPDGSGEEDRPTMDELGRQMEKVDIVGQDRKSVV